MTSAVAVAPALRPYLDALVERLRAVTELEAAR